jgi:hypothetical protein
MEKKTSKELSLEPSEIMSPASCLLLIMLGYEK